MTDRNIRRSAVVGLVITAVLITLTVSAGALNIFQRHYTVRADFASASGVGSGDPVRVAGVDVGKVTGVERLPGLATVRISMAVKKSIWLADGTRASVRLRTLLGARYVELDTPPSGPVLTGARLIPLSRTEVPAELDATLNALNSVAQPFDVNAFNGVIRSFAASLDNGHAQQLNGMLGDLANLSGALASHSQDLDRLIAATGKLSSAMDDRNTELGASIDNFSTILDTLAARRDQLTELVASVNGLAQKLTPLLANNQGTIDHTLGDLLSTVQVLDHQRHRLDLALSNFPAFAQHLTKVADRGSFIQIYYVGSIPGPYAADPIDLGDAQSGEPGQSGGLPRLWVNPPASAPNANVAGTQIQGGDQAPTPPQGYPPR